MPDLNDSIVKDLKERAQRFLTETGGYEDLEFLSAGGSAAVFKVVRGGEVSALKVYNPQFLEGSNGSAERRRLDVQKRLISHDCESLVQTYHITEAENTAFVEMEFIPWPQLTKCLEAIPDKAIVPLISQLVDAVKFLESQNIVHRDIKPDNIHVSPDFSHLKLLDLGVAREFDSAEVNDACVTDNGHQRPFLATAQYSSPEYLFRLDEPTTKLWHGLNIYQIGAVLHDLIKKEPLFGQEMSLGNRWLVARAVLTKQPSFSDSAKNRLVDLKALATRCLTKDLETRLAIVGWEDFLLEGALDPVSSLRGKLAKRAITAVSGREESAITRLKFDRLEFMKRITERVRADLIHTCGTQLPLSLIHSSGPDLSGFKYEMAVTKHSSICCHLEFDWQSELYQNRANVNIGAQIVQTDKNDDVSTVIYRLVCEAVIQEAEDEVGTLITNEMARLIGQGLDSIDADENVECLHGLNLQQSQLFESEQLGDND